MLHFYRNERYGYINRNNEPNKRYFVVLNQLNIKMARYYNKYVDNDNIHLVITEPVFSRELEPGDTFYVAYNNMLYLCDNNLSVSANTVNLKNRSPVKSFK